VALFALITAVFWRFIAATMVLATLDDRFTHILLILPISSSLIFADRNLLHENVSLRSSVVSFVGILTAIAIGWKVSLSVLPLYRTPDEQLTFVMLIVIGLWIASFAVCLGAQIVRALPFPLMFLLWMVPIPELLLQKIVQYLQQGSAVATWLLFRAVGVPALRNGVLVSIPGLTVEVAKECSSIRSSLMLLVTTMVLAHVLLKSSRRKTLLILSAIPLSVAKNGLRIFTIAMLGTRVDRSFLSGRLHHDGGIVFFLLALLVIGMLLRVLRKGEQAAKKESSLGTIANHIPSFVIDGPRN
jgi:exosortase